jgi:phosphoglycerate kinase
MAKVTIRDLDVKGKRVLARVDFNVPLEEKDGRRVITDETRIQETLPTIRFLRDAGAKVVLMSHLGRPKGAPEAKYSLRPVAERLGEILGTPVAFASDCIGAETAKLADGLEPGGVLLLENLRFHPGEEKNEADFASELAKLGEVYVNDAFGTAHRAHASTEGVAKRIPARAIGFLMEKELKFLGEETSNPKRPFVVILGGAKVSDKIGVIDALLEKADAILIGGAMAYTFALAQGRKVGKSLSEPDKLAIAKEALDKAKAKGVRMLLPVDNMIVDSLDFDAKKLGQSRFTARGEDIPDGWEGVDIGPETVSLFEKEIEAAGTILWNGPMGIFEIQECAKGTFAIASAIAANSKAISIIGGGDSVKAVNQSGMAGKVTFMSTGGGASLEFLEGQVLPGVAVIPDK